MKIIIRLLTCSGCFFSDLKEISLKDFAYVYVIVVYKLKKGDESIIIPVINEVICESISVTQFIKNIHVLWEEIIIQPVFAILDSGYYIPLMFITIE